MALPLSLLCAALALNLWVGYFPTVQTAWNQLTAGPLPDQTDEVTVTAMQQERKIPPKGTVVPVDISDAASGFRHRGELVYLPPAWYATNPPPKLPTVMMIGGEFNTPADWLRTGGAVKMLDDFAAAHHGNAPCRRIRRSRRRVQQRHRVRQRQPRQQRRSPDQRCCPVHGLALTASAPTAAKWGIVGWSMGGTCAVDLAVMHPDMFSAFEDIAGDIGPNSGTKDQTIARLFGGNADAWAAFDPTTVITKHGPYTGVAGWFDVNGSTATIQRAKNDQAAAANSLCALGAANGINCAVVSQPGKHDWPFASHAFAAALPWLAGQIGTPDVPPSPLPTGAPSPSFEQAAAR